MVDINSPEYMPEGWERCGEMKPPLEHHADSSVYELHVRDFSMMDRTVPETARGTPCLTNNLSRDRQRRPLPP